MRRPLLSGVFGNFGVVALLICLQAAPSAALPPRIFFSDYFHDRLDAQARHNLATELAGL